MERKRRLDLHLMSGCSWGGPVSGVMNEEAVLRDLAEQYPTLQDLRLASPPGAEGFLKCTAKQSEKWPVASLIDGYLDSLP